MKKIILQLVFLLLTLTAISCRGNKDNNDVLILATGDMLPPFTYIGGESYNEIIGFDIELAKIIASDMGKTLVVRPMAFTDIFIALEKGEVDMALRAITITDERKKRVDFSTSYYKTSPAAVARKEDDSFENIRTKEDLGASKKIAVETGTTGLTIAREIARDQNNVIETHSLEYLLMELLSLQVDAIIIDKEAAISFVNRYTNLKMLQVEFDVENYGVAIQKGNKKLLESVDRTINRLVNSGEYMNLVEEHVHSYLSK